MSWHKLYINMSALLKDDEDEKLEHEFDFNQSYKVIFVGDFGKVSYLLSLILWLNLVKNNRSKKTYFWWVKLQWSTDLSTIILTSLIKPLFNALFFKVK